MDCFVLPSDEMFGELAHYKRKLNFGFKEKIEPGLFAALFSLLDHIAPGADIPAADAGMVIGRLRDEKWSYYNFTAPDRYQPTVPEAEIWRLIDSVFKKRLQERVKTDETIVA